MSATAFQRKRREQEAVLKKALEKAEKEAKKKAEKEKELKEKTNGKAAQ